MPRSSSPTAIPPFTESSTSGDVEFAQLEYGIFSANAIKAKNTRMIAMGVGDGVSGDPNNLQAISGMTPNKDYYQTSNYAAAGNALRTLALGSCKGSISVVKQVVPYTAPPGSTAGATPAGGWTFGATTNTQGVTITPDPADERTNDTTGAMSFGLDFPGGTSTANVSITETQQPGYTLQPVGGKNAVCQRLDTNPPSSVTVTDIPGQPGFTVQGSEASP